MCKYAKRRTFIEGRDEDTFAFNSRVAFRNLFLSIFTQREKEFTSSKHMLNFACSRKAFNSTTNVGVKSKTKKVIVRLKGMLRSYSMEKKNVCAESLEREENIHTQKEES